MRTYRSAFIRFQSKARFARIILFACLCVAAFLFVLPAAVFAQTADNFGLDSNFSDVGIQSTGDLQGTIARIINIGLGFLGIVAVIIILYAGYLWMTAGGNEEHITRAKMMLRNAVIGLVIILSSWGIAAFVISRLSSATGGGGGNGGGCEDGGCSLTTGGNVAAFVVDSFETTHGGTDASQDVYLCSSIQAQFNHWLNTEPFESLKNGDTLALKRDNGGTFVDEETIEIIKRNNVISFKRIDGQNVDTNGNPIRVDWTKNAMYEVRLDTTLEDSRGLVLSGCDDCGGTRDDGTGEYHYWKFSTGTTNDEVEPTLSVSYPGSGDTNVPRSTVFILQFSEAIDVASVITAAELLDTTNVVLERKLADGTYESAFGSSVFDTSLQGNRIQFSLNKNHVALFDGISALLEPYTEYRLTVQHIEDLCGNALIAPVEITFTTGADMPGVSFVRPSDGYAYACQATPVFLKFNTSMYNVRTQSCGVSASGNAGLVLGGSLNPSGTVLRSLPEDNFSGAGNPNDFCREYQFDLDPNDTSDDLIPETEYAASVDYISPGGDVGSPEQYAWSFQVKPAGQCAQEPYISYVSGLRRNAGQWQQCLTVQGAYFYVDEAKTTGSRVATTLSLDSPLNTGAITAAMQTAWPANSGLTVTDNAWQDKSIAADFISQPDSTTKPIPVQPNVDFDVAVEVMHPAPIGLLKSNVVRFTVDTTKTFTGPCLYSISPTSGYWGDSVTLRGSRLGGASSDELTFYDAKTQLDSSIIATGGSWNATRIQSRVPDQAQNNPADGEVYVTVGGIQSNKLEFNIAAGVGQSCSSVPGTCSPDPGLCSPGLECAPSNCTCQVPDTFKITSVAPTASCTDSCTTAVISFETNMDIGDTSGNRIQVKKCADTALCSWDDSGATLVTATVTLDSAQRVKVAPTSSLDLGSRYIVRVLGGSSGVLSSGGKQIANLNSNTDTVAGKDSYVWSFKTGSSECVVERIEMDQRAIAIYEGDVQNLGARAFARPNGCASSGQEITASNNFTWKACEYISGDIAFECRTSCSVPELLGGDQIILVSSSATKQSTATAENGQKDGSAKALACAFYNDGAVSVKDGAIATVYAACNTDADCQQGSSCPGSVCLKTDPNKGRCTPVINDFNPKNGKPGTWVTIDGCYFGNTSGRVDIGGNPSTYPAIAVLPSAAWCGTTWSDSQIIAEVANDAINTGPVRVTRIGYDPVAASGSFTPNALSHPGICRVSPAQGRARAIVAIRGQGFGATPGQVVFTDSGAAAHPTVEVVDAVTRSSCPTDGWDNGQVCIRVVAGAASGQGSVRVVQNGATSNLVTFTILGSIPPGSENSNNLVVTSYAPGDGSSACLNMIVGVTLNRVVVSESVGFEPGDPATTTANFYVRRISDESLVQGTVDYTTRGNQTIFRLYPNSGQLSLATNYQIVLKGGASGLRSVTGGIMATDEFCNILSPGDIAAGITSSDCVINFRTVNLGQDDQCRVAKLEVAPVNSVFTCAGRNNCAGDQDSGQVGHQRIFEAIGKNTLKQEVVVNSPLVWSSSDESVLVSNAPFTATLTSSQNLFSILPVSGGVSVITANIENTNISGSTEARVLLCENPWPTTMAADGLPFQDKTGGALTTKNVKTNFSTFYCRDQVSGGLLPELDMRAETGIGENLDLPNLLKEFFFIQPASTDAIGIRVLSNTANLSIREWYNAQGYGGNPSSIASLDGFDALQDGRTMYVAAPNDTNPAGASASIYNNIYLLSTNNNPAADTVAIINQMVSNWRFLVNMVNQEDKQKFKDDLIRIRDAHTIAELIKTKQPTLASGSFKQGVSLSTWPSWQILSTDFGATLPTDPVNDIHCEGIDIDQNTCWNPANQNYVCNTDAASEESHVYFYKYKIIGATHQAVAQFNLAYGPSSKWGNVLAGAGWNTSPTDQCSNLEYAQSVP